MKLKWSKFLSMLIVVSLMAVQFVSVPFMGGAFAGDTTPVTGVTLDKTTDTITVGGSDTLTATISPADATDQSVTWSSSNESVATVVYGTVTGMAPGAAAITVTTADGAKTASCSVVVQAAVSNTSVSVSPATKSVNAGDTFTMDVVVTPGVAIAGAQFNLSYDPSLLGVTSVTEGNFLKQGGATSYFLPGTINNTAGSLTNVAGTTTNHGAEVTGPGIFATVAFQAKAAGTSALTLSEVVASTKEGVAVPVQLTNGSITVQGGATTIPVTGVTLDKTSDTITVGASDTLTATVAPADATNKAVTWSSDNTAVATVDQTGKVTAVSAGAGIITVTTADGAKTASCSVTVQAAVSSTAVSVSPATKSVNAGDTFTMDVVVTPGVAIAGAQFNLSYDPSLLAVTSVTEGNFLKQGGSTSYFQPGEIDNTTGNLKNVIGVTTIKGAEVAGQGTFATVTFQAKAAGTSSLALSEVVASTKEGVAVPVQITNGSVTVQSGAITVTGVTLNKATDTITVGASDTLTATVAPDNATNKAVTWTSSNTAVATVDATGKITAVAVGAATVTVTTADGAKTASCSVTVQAAVSNTSVSVSPATKSVNAGDTFTMDVVVTPGVAIAGAQFNLNYDPSLLAVTSVAEGNFLKQGGSTSYFQPGEIDNTTGNLKNVIGVTTIKGAEVTGQGTFATVTFQAKAAGTSALTLSEVVASTKEGVAVPVQLTNGSITVQGGATTIPVTGVTLDKTSDTITVGASDTLTATVAPADATNKAVTWSSDNTAVATVDATGKITAVAVGAATITVTTADGSKTASCSVTVQGGVTTVPVTGVTLDKTSDTITVGASDQLTATVAPADATNKAVTWSSDNEAVATVDQAGKVTAVAAGNAIITVTTADGNKTATCAVKVLKIVKLTSDFNSLTITDEPVMVNVPSGVTNPQLTVTPAVSGDNKVFTMPQVDVNASTTIGAVKVIIPSGTQITAPASWEGQIQLPTIVSDPSNLPSNATSAIAIAVGSDTASLTFSKPVCITLPGQSGKNVGFIRNGVFTQITATLSRDQAADADSAAAALQQKSAREGYYDNGTDITIWTLHFTMFVAYKTSGGTSGSGGGSTITTPSVQTSDATAITDTSATLNGSIASGGGATVTAYGFLWGIEQSNLDQKQQVGTDNHSGSFQAGLSGLTAKTTYYFKAYATNSQGTRQGDLKQFTTASATSPPPVPALVFSDVPASYWASDAINDLNSRGYVSGYPDGSFKPDNNITRAEFAVMLVKALGLKPPTEAQVQFQDVPATSWCYASVATAAQAGLIKGLGEGIFAPNTPITREQMAVMIVKALESAGYTTSDDMQALNKFGDRNSVDAWALQSMARAVNAGVVHGVTTATIAPLEKATRAQAAAMVQTLLKLAKKL